MAVWVIIQLHWLPLFSSLIHHLDKNRTWDFFLMQYPSFLSLWLLLPLYLSKHSYIYLYNSGKIFVFPALHLGEKKPQRFSEDSKFRFLFSQHSLPLSKFGKVNCALNSLVPTEALSLKNFLNKFFQACSWVIHLGSSAQPRIKLWSFPVLLWYLNNKCPLVPIALSVFYVSLLCESFIRSY